MLSMTNQGNYFLTKLTKFLKIELKLINFLFFKNNKIIVFYLNRKVCQNFVKNTLLTYHNSTNKYNNNTYTRLIIELETLLLGPFNPTT